MVDTKAELIEKAINGENTDKFFEEYMRYQNKFLGPKRRKKKVKNEKDRNSWNKKKRQSISL